MATSTRIGTEEPKQETLGTTTPKENKGTAKKIVAVTMASIVAITAVGALVLSAVNRKDINGMGKPSVEKEETKPGTNPGTPGLEEASPIEVTGVDLSLEEKAMLVSKIYTGRKASKLEKLDVETISVLGTGKTDVYQYAYVALAEPTKVEGETVDVMYKIAYELTTDLTNLAEAPIATSNGLENGSKLMEKYEKLEDHVADTDFTNAVNYIEEQNSVAEISDVYVKEYNEKEDGMITQNVCYVAVTKIDDKTCVIDNQITLDPVAFEYAYEDFADVIIAATAPKEVVTENTSKQEETMTK